ncbi:hypothetical protein [Bacillus sp. 03113]|uniref:hypothetical protein n=1 Tax=Bacillus sp. 03113 TaxID=2578211 RepID=UPI0015E8C473|nr:hypothetical protein [Bacillus sp. 03113]
MATNEAQALQMVEAVKRQNVAVLGDGEVFVKKVNGGAIRSVKGAISLHESNGEIAVIQGKAMTTAKGFNSLNQIAGLSIITPEKLTLPDGQIVVNPYPILDPDSSTISKVWVKKIAIGYSPIGNLVITSATLLYDIRMYFIQDVMKKVGYSQGAGRVTIEQTLTDEEKKTGIFLKIDGMMGVWANFQHKDILKAIDTFINKKQFAERNAQSICERLVMSKHPALASAAYVSAQGPDKNRTAKVPVVGYVHDFNREELLDIAEKAEKGEEIKIDNQKVNIIETTAEATEVDMVADMDDEERFQQDPVQEPIENPSYSTTRPTKAANLFDFDEGGRF